MDSTCYVHFILYQRLYRYSKSHTHNSFMSSYVCSYCTKKSNIPIFSIIQTFNCIYENNTWLIYYSIHASNGYRTWQNIEGHDQINPTLLNLSFLNYPLLYIRVFPVRLQRNRRLRPIVSQPFPSVGTTKRKPSHCLSAHQTVYFC